MTDTSTEPAGIVDATGTPVCVDLAAQFDTMTTLGAALLEEKPQPLYLGMWVAQHPAGDCVAAYRKWATHTPHEAGLARPGAPVGLVCATCAVEIEWNPVSDDHPVSKWDCTVLKPGPLT